ncbi:DNA polymerase III subunit alpha [Entomobacter blattae]|uniref:DNA polymerase III subunit alpha n=1 Tax=Entomobacter blattae TaxID=2762277 RepID=A0A7H1NSY8_9PROT|nr:DNA polymerase III subunit alpha [Entomobacter blattae]QNT78898.1 DNA polymerase III subunit alpha [Entomobacter blattae]
MTYANFIHLHNHSAYSLSQGAMRVADLVALAEHYSMPAVAMTDSGNMFGALEFSQYSTSKGIQPIIGCEIGVILDFSDNKNKLSDFQPWQKPVVILAKTEEGLSNIQKLSSYAFIHGEDPSKPSVPLEVLLQHTSGVYLLTGGSEGVLSALFEQDRSKEAYILLERLSGAFKDNIAIEINRHGQPLERSIEPELISLADKYGLPLVATNNCYFSKQEMYEAHDALICIAQGCTMAEENRWRVTPEHWFKPPTVMRELFADIPDACDNTIAIAQKCSIKFPTRKPMLPVSPKVDEGKTEDETLREMANKGLQERLKDMALDEKTKRIYQERLTFELGVISSMGFPGYFMIVADFIQWAKEHDIPVGPGRGSGAGSLVAWALTITDLDPIPFNLLFERFLNPERISMPDFDIDFCQDRRDEVISYVRNEYGADRVAQIITFGKLQARAAVRDVGRVLGLPYGMVNRVAELIPNNPAKPVKLAQAIEEEPRLQEMRDSDDEIRRLLEIAQQLEGLYRHASTHAAGVVIGDRKLDEVVPLYRDPRSDMLVTQFNMKYVEQAGLVKFDFLGLTTLTVLQRGVNMLKELDVSINLSQIPLDDPLTYEMLSRGDTAGVFQFEGAGMRDVLKQMRPSRLEDLIAAVALYRPGPMANIPDYCHRKHGEEWQPPHEDLRDILAETYGIMVYQEQVMQIAQKMGGYSLGAADILRRAMGKKIRSEMDQQKIIFTQGAIERGVSEEKAAEVFELMAKFADYGFNKSHAAAYALVSYRTAWMKANYPVAFIAACMSLAREKTDKLASLRQEALRMGIEILPPDINKSFPDFKIEINPESSKQSIRYALGAIKKVGFHAMEQLVKARGQRPFASIEDFSERINPKFLNKMQLENLAKAGAFDSLDKDRAKIYYSAEIILKYAHAVFSEKESGQNGLFSSGVTVAKNPMKLVEETKWMEFEKLSQEAEAIGFHLTNHPLDSYKGFLKKKGVIPSAYIDHSARAGQGRVFLAGCIIDKKERPTKTGKKMAWVRLSDSYGGFEVTFFSETLHKVRDVLIPGLAVLITAELRIVDDAVRITAFDAEKLEEIIGQTATQTRIWLKDTTPLPYLKDLLSQLAFGKGQVLMVPEIKTGRELEMCLPDTYGITPEAIERIKTFPGIVKVEQA